MIAKAKSITHTSKSIDYCLKKDKAEIIDKRFVFGSNGKAISKEFKLFQDLNTRCEKNTISFVLSPDPKDGTRLSNNDFKAISESFLEKLGLTNHQAIIIKHSEKKHTHLHILCNRINTKGKAYADNFISKKSQSIVDTIAKEYSLIRAKEVQNFKKLETKEIKKDLYKIHQEVLKSNPKDFLTYSKLMYAKGIEIKPTINKSNNLQGFRVLYQNFNLKASEIHRNMTLYKMTLEKSIDLNPVLKLGIELTKSTMKNISRGL